MKKVYFLLVVLCFILSACIFPTMPAPQPQASSSAPLPQVDTQATVEISVKQTLDSLPTSTLVPSDTPVVTTATSTPTQAKSTSTETQNPLLLTLTATLGTGTVTPGSPTPGTPGALTATPTSALSATPTETLHPQHYGTMPPNLPFGEITLINKSKAEVYISLQCTTKDGYVTIIEYPVGGRLEINAPAGKYVYVAWVGGNKLIGTFGLDKSQDLTLTIFKDRVEIR